MPLTLTTLRVAVDDSIVELLFTTTVVLMVVAFAGIVKVIAAPAPLLTPFQVR
jgi:hypothetical protein